MFWIIYALATLFILTMFIFTFASILSHEFRAKVMRHQLKTNAQVLEENMDLLRDINTKTANIEKDGITIKNKTIRDGFSRSTIYCKPCGKLQ